MFLRICTALALALPLGAAAGTSDPTCDARARAESGYRAGAGPEFTSGSVTARISGSVAFGISRGDKGYPVAPAGAGQASVERREAEARTRYERAYRDCVAGL